MQDDHVSPGGPVPRKLAANEAPVVDDELEVQRRICLHASQVHDVAWAMSRWRERKAKYERSIVSRSVDAPQTPSSAYEKTASPSSFDTLSGGWRFETTTFIRSESTSCACSSSGPEEVRRVPGDVGEDEGTRLGCR